MNFEQSHQPELDESSRRDQERARRQITRDLGKLTTGLETDGLDGLEDRQFTDVAENAQQDAAETTDGLDDLETTSIDVPDEPAELSTDGLDDLEDAPHEAPAGWDEQLTTDGLDDLESRLDAGSSPDYVEGPLSTDGLDDLESLDGQPEGLVEFNAQRNRPQQPPLTPGNTSQSRE